MSKAFTRESDDAPEVPLRPRRLSALPPGTKNYLTASGARQMRADLGDLLVTGRDQLASLPASDEVKRRLDAVNERIEQIEASLSSAVIVEPPPPPHELVRFGATVVVRHRNNEESGYRIVGVDETDLDRDWISWLSPIAKALLNRRVGQAIRIKLPAGDDELTILSIHYE